ncbi:MAG: c-type cytochrome [Verrucomicrobia bacterium]|nr:c-type cytochrome [Verrucomicrobiota bacterium]
MCEFVAFAADPFADGVRPTDPLTPEQQQKTFHLPPGFEIQLVAAEPDLRKPLNMAFDTLGRLWITESREYPFAAPLDKPARDSIRIFSDFDDTGRARKVTIFADGLNIPIGLYPFCSPASDGQSGFTWKCIAWSIPNIWLFEDLDGDGKSDKREILYGPFDHTRDTHGNQASFRRGFDGWLYATHGFNNDSHVKGRDGHEVHLNSGNTYRMRLDGSRIEHHTWGQVNPFGLAWDPFGNLYSSDCHSAPTYQLLAGGYYPSFGKPHDGLGFAPVLMEHSHGSTAIDGMLYYADDLWPQEFHGNIFVGNVMTSRVNRDRLEFHGSTPKAVELDDFVKTDDPWFRPVDNQLGPDGAFYMADFYNRIIGHYEVPLMHPGRDRERGRLWRVVYKGTDGRAKLRPLALPKELAGLINELASPNLPRRMLAMNAIFDQFGKPAVAPLQRALEQPKNAFQESHLLWLLHRLEASKVRDLAHAAEARSPLVRVHAQRIAADIFDQDSRGHLASDPETDIHHIATADEMATNGLKDRDALVQRCAAEAWRKFRLAGTSIVKNLLELRARVPANDTHLLYVVRKSIRDQLNTEATFAAVLKAGWNETEARALADVVLGVRSPLAGTFLLRNLGRLDQGRTSLAAALQHAARYAPAAELEPIAPFVREKFPGDTDFQVALFASVEQGVTQSGTKLSDTLRNWGTELCAGALQATPDTAWWNTPLDGAYNPRNPWAFQERGCSDGRRARLLSSHPLGETLTGTLRSRAFALPAQLSFYLAGHQGEPTRPPHQRNAVQLRSSDTGAVLAEAFPPRNDTAQKITWDLAAHAGKPAYLEVTDGDAADAWAWLAFGRFDPAVVSLPSVAPGDIARRQQTAAELAGRLRLPVLAQVQPIALRSDYDVDARAAAARALASLDRETAANLLPPVLTNAAQPLTLREGIGLALVETDLAAARSTVVAAMKSAPHRVQLRWALALAANAAGADALLQAVDTGNAPPVLLQVRAVKDRVLAANPTDAAGRLAKLTKGLAPVDLMKDRTLAQRVRTYPAAAAKPSEGQRVFQQNCAVCHRVDGEGGLIGPQLDGIGNRGLERLVEDVLDTNRNVDRAFRSHLLKLKDGEVVSGLPRREEGELLILADSTGKEISVPKKNIESSRESETSLMPENFADVITPEDFHHLMAFLLSKRSEQAAKP